MRTRILAAVEPGAASTLWAEPPYIDGMSTPIAPQVARLDSRALIAVTGPEARPFLHNLLTQDVETLGEAQVRFGALLSPPGRLLFDLFIVGRTDGVWLDVAADRRDALLQRLSMYRLRAKVEVDAIEAPVFAAWGETPVGFVADPRWAGMGARGYGVEVQPTTDEAAYHDHRLGQGLPDPDADGGRDTTYPIEADFDLLNGIDFHKGCFIGQETTSRMWRRGAIKNRMLPVRVSGGLPAPGAEVLNGELRAGVLASGQGERAIGLLRLDRLEGALTVEGRPLEVVWPDWAPRP